jgi:glycerophosphoryl diester phosphodiesterase
LHEAASGVVENTASAFRAAVAANYAIECDLQLSADGEAMVYHDFALGRLTEGLDRLDAMPAAALKRIAFKATADRMQTLGELCDLVADRVTLALELKSRFDGDHQLAARTAAVLAGYSGRVVVMSFDPGPIAVLRHLAPTLARGLVAQRRDPYASSDASLPTLSYARQILARPHPRWLKDLSSALPLFARHALRCHSPDGPDPEDRARAARFADQMIFRLSP